MSLQRKYISRLIYILALLLLVGGAVDVTLSFWDFIRNGKGIGVYGSLIYYAIALISVILWAISYFLSKSNKLAVLFWLTLLLLTAFIATQPSWWAAP